MSAGRKVLHVGGWSQHRSSSMINADILFRIFLRNNSALVDKSETHLCTCSTRTLDIVLFRFFRLGASLIYAKLATSAKLFRCARVPAAAVIVHYKRRRRTTRHTGPGVGRAKRFVFSGTRIVVLIHLAAHGNCACTIDLNIYPHLWHSIRVSTNHYLSPRKSVSYPHREHRTKKCRDT